MAFLEAAAQACAAVLIVVFQIVWFTWPAWAMFWALHYRFGLDGWGALSLAVMAQIAIGEKQP